MSQNRLLSESMAISDPPVDLEKGDADVKATATDEEELTVVDPCIATFIKIFLGVFYSVAVIDYALIIFRLSENLRDTWPVVFILCPILFVATLAMIPMVLRACIKKFATTHVHASDLSTKLLAPSKN